MTSLHKKCLLIIAALAALAPLPRAMASDFSLPFINGADLGDAYSGWAASASDASTAFTNPAGLVKLNHQQLVLSGIGIMGSTQFTGSTSIPIFPGQPPQVGSASSKIRGFAPGIYYAAPAYKNLVFALSETVPFALGTNYGTDSIVRYSNTRTSVAVVDLGPSIGFKINEQLSAGIGFDAATLSLTLNNMYGPPLTFTDEEGQNHVSGWGYGWHGGVLYQPRPSTSIGLSFNSMLVVHAYGNSELFTTTAGQIRTTNQYASAAFPARTYLSVTQDINPRITVMATLFYTNWRTLNQLTLQNTVVPFGALLAPGAPIPTQPVTIPFQYHNTFDYALGFKFKATDKWLLRTGAMALTTPSNNRDRGVADPSGGYVLLGFGAHYTQDTRLSYDLSYARGIFQTTHVNQTTLLSALSGHSSQNINVFGAQLNWNIT